MNKADSPLPFASDGSFFEQFQALQKQQQQQQQQNAVASSSAAEPSSAVEAVATQQLQPESKGQEEEDSEFIASTSFAGSKRGYIFKSDERGLGYYKDVGLEGWLQKRQEAAKAKPTAIKANKTIAKIPSRGGGEPSAKKAKTDGKPKYLREMEKYKKLSCSGDTNSHALVK